MNEGLEVDPSPSSFLPLIFVLRNSTNLLSFTCFYNLSLSKLPPTSDTSYTLFWYRVCPRHLIVPGNLQATIPDALHVNTR